jgi:large subunit ribosomal protein L19
MAFDRNILSRQTIRSIGQYDREFPEFAIGDTVEVALRIKEGAKERIQQFKGDVIARKNNGASSTFTVRKLGTHSVYVERIFPLYSPLVKDIKVVRKGRIRRAKLYYLRDRVGKSARIKEKIVAKNKK